MAAKADTSVSIALRLVDQVTGPMQRAMRTLQGQSRQLEKSMRSLTRSVNSLWGAFGAWQTGQFLKGFIDTAASIERLEVLLAGVTGSSKTAKDSIQWVYDLATRAPFTIESITNAFVRLKTIGLDPTNGSLQAILDALAYYGKSSEDLRLTILAIEQMAGKGVISLEELRRQLGERIPTAVRIMARELGMRLDEFLKAISQGLIKSKEGINALLRGFEKDFHGASKRMMGIWYGFTAQLSVRWKLIQKEIMDQNIFLYMKAGLQVVLDTIDELKSKGAITQWAKDTGKALAKMADVALTGIRYMHAGILTLQAGMDLVRAGFWTAVDAMKGVLERLLRMVKSTFDSLGRMAQEAGYNDLAIKLFQGGRMAFRGILNLRDAEKNRNAALQDAERHMKEVAGLEGKYQGLKDKINEAADALERLGGNSGSGGGAASGGASAADQTLITVTNLKNQTKKAVDVMTSYWEAAARGVNDYIDEGRHGMELLRDATHSAFDSMEDAFVEFVQNGKMSWKDLVNSMLEDFLRMAYKMSTSQMFMPFVSAWFGSSSGGAGTTGSFQYYEAQYGNYYPMIHSGGVVGVSEPSGWKNVDPSVFSKAPRLHTGLAPDEFPAILQRGETVIPRGARLAPPPVTVNVVNNTGTESEVKKEGPRWDGRQWVIDVMLDAVNRRSDVRSAFGIA